MTDSRYSRRHGFLAAIFDRVLIFFFRWTNRFIAWHRLPRWLGVANLIALRVELRQHNLYDTDGDLTHPKESCPFHPGPGATTLRTPNGTLNDLQHPAMGCRYSRFGRNMSTKRPVTSEPHILHPNPLVVSQRLLARKEFKPATSLNLLAAAWIQFQVHDWFGHENESLAEENKIRVPQSGDWHQPALEIAPTKLDPTNSKPLSSRYPGELENVDTMVGMFCEPLPRGFGFSDTAFRIFILMASRRLKSDRFFTTDYRPEFYTTTGLKWIARTGLKEMILRHYPQLAPAFVGVTNPFAPWKS